MTKLIFKLARYAAKSRRRPPPCRAARVAASRVTHSIGTPAAAAMAALISYSVRGAVCVSFEDEVTDKVKLPEICVPPVTAVVVVVVCTCTVI